EKHYAAHIKNTLDAAAINVMRPKAAKAAEKMAKAVAGGNGKGKSGGKSGRPEKAVRTKLVADVDLAPGALTAENTG
ncbi:MAG: hypothetical protein B7Z81_13790, partial [Acidocella sp. 20-61-6]